MYCYKCSFHSFRIQLFIVKRHNNENIIKYMKIKSLKLESHTNLFIFYPKRN